MGDITSKCCTKEFDSSNVSLQKDIKDKLNEGKFNSNQDENRDRLNDYSIQKTKATASVIIKEELVKSENKISAKEKMICFENLVTKLSSLYRGKRFRNFFQNKFKQDLIGESKDYFRKILEGFDLSALEKAENNRRKQYSSDGWQEFYTDNPELFKIEYGRTYFSRIFSKNLSEFYTGQVNEKNQKHGFGTLITSQGEKYCGHFFNNQKSGWGEFISKDSNIFQGLFKNNCLTGKGEKYSFNGDYFKGEFDNFQKHGIGYEETKSYLYWGNFLNDKKNLKGKIEYKHNNDVYEGDFEDDSITGIGLYRWKNGDVFIGDFANGKMHGKGTYKWPDGAEYVGNYVENLKIGEGKFKWSNGKVYHGPFVNGKQHGNGKILYPDGKYKEVVFENGKLVSSQS